MKQAAPGSARGVVLTGLLLCGVAAAWVGQQRLQFGTPRETGAWILAAGITAAVAVLLAAARRGVPPDEPRRRVTVVECLAVLALILLGAAFRLIHFDTTPEGLNHDAAWYGLYAIFINQGAPYTPYTAAGFGRETLFMYLVAPLVQWLGNTPEALQLASTLCGIAALLPLYGLARAMFGRRVALLALGFLAVSGWHGVFSRAGWRVITVPPVEMLALYGAWLAGQRGGWGAALLAGGGAALSLYTYNAARIVPALTGLAYLLAVPWRRRAWSRAAAGALLGLTAFVVVGLPMLRYATAHFEEFQRRVDAVADERVGQGGGWAVNAWDAVRMFNYRGNGDDFFVDEPLLEPLAAVGVLLGAAVALSRIRRPAYAFVLIGLIVSLLPALASAPNGNRAITAIPFVYLLIAVGLDAVLAQIVAQVSTRWALTASSAAVAIAIGVAGMETYAQFLGPSRRPLRGASAGATGAALFVRQHAGDYAPHVISQWPDNAFLYLAHTGSRSPFVIPWPFASTFEEIDAEIDRRGRQGLLFVLDFSPEADVALEELRRRYPEHRFESIPAPRGGGPAVGRALFVEAAAAAAPWRNFSRTLQLGRAPGEPPAAALRCGAALGDASGVSAHVGLMLPQLGPPRRIGEVAFRRHCDSAGDALLTLAVEPAGLIAAAAQEATLIPWTDLEAGRWYDVYVAVRVGQPSAEVRVEGGPSPVTLSLPVDARMAVQISGVALRVDTEGVAGGGLYVDDLTVVGGVLDASDAMWIGAAAPYRTSGGGIPPELERRAEPAMLVERFDAFEPGSIAGEPGWDPVVGAVAVSPAPRVAPPRRSPLVQIANAFSGGAGGGQAQFDEPTGVAIDPDGNFYVTERLGNRVQKFAADGTYLAGWGRLGDAPGEFREPMDAVADEQFLYVVDSWNQRIQAFDFAGTFQFEIRGSNEQPFYGPRGIDARHGNVYLTDSGRGIVRVFDGSGVQVATMGEHGGDGLGHLSEPVDVAVGAAGRVYVVNSGNNRIEVFRPDGSVDGAFPVPGWEGPELKEGYLATDADGVLYLSDPQSGRVRRFTTDGDELASLDAGLDFPGGLEVDGERTIVSVRLGNGVRQFALPRVGQE